MAGKGLGTASGAQPPGLLRFFGEPTSDPSGGAKAEQVGRPGTPSGGGAIHPHIAQVLQRHALTGSPTPTPDTQPQPIQKHPGPSTYTPPYGAVTDPLVGYAQAVINKYSAKPGQQVSGQEQSAFTNYVNNLNVTNPDTGPQIQEDIIRLLAPEYNPSGFASNTPVEQSDITPGARNNNMSWLAQQLTNQTSRYGGVGSQTRVGGNLVPGVSYSGRSAIASPGSADTKQAGGALEGALQKIQQETPGIDRNTAYHLLEWDILKKGGDLSTKDAQALYSKWQQTPTMSPQAAAQQIMPAFQQLENQKAQNAVDYITMTSKQRTAAGLTSAALTAIGMPTYVPKTPQMVQQYVDYFLQYQQQAEMQQLVKLMTPLNTLQRQNTKAQLAGQNAGQSGNAFQDFLTNVLATPATTDPFTNTTYAGASAATTDPNVDAVP